MRKPSLLLLACTTSNGLILPPCYGYQIIPIKAPPLSLSTRRRAVHHGSCFPLQNSIGGDGDSSDVVPDISSHDASGDFVAESVVLDTLESGIDVSDVTAVDHHVVLEPIHPAATPQPSSSLMPSDYELSSRRDWLKRTTILLAGTVIGGATIEHNVAPTFANKKLGAVNLTRVVQSTSLNVTVEGPLTCVAMDGTSFQKKQTLKLPNWVPPALVPPPRVIRDISPPELLFASIVAGSILEMARTPILYPLLTLKTRIQTDIKTRRRSFTRKQRSFKIQRRWKIAQLNIRRHFQEGNLYAGIVPSLLVSVPATGVYYAIRDVVKRGLVMAPLGDVSIALVAAFCGDVISLLIRTPADALSIRLQKATGDQVHNEQDEQQRAAIMQAKVGDWFMESLERLPAVTLTDLPYLLSRIALNRSILTSGHVDLGRYEMVVIGTAVLCGILTTPFDVARTRILVDSDDDPTNGIDGGSGEGLLQTFQTILQEGNGGVSNLYAGWLERTAYLAIGRAWLEPLQIVGYIALRDAILLEWFD